MEQDVKRLAEEIATRAADRRRRAILERDQLSTMLTAAETRAGQAPCRARRQNRSTSTTATATRPWPRPTSTAWKRSSSNWPSAETTVKIENFPTPISKMVDEKEAHFQLRRGRIAYVPFNEFAGKFRSLFEQKAHKLRDTDEITETIGPLGDFTIRYTLARVEIPLGRGGEDGAGGELHPTVRILFLSPGRRHRRAGRRSHGPGVVVSRQARRVQSPALHDHVLDLSRQLRRFQSRPQRAVSTGLCRRRPADVPKDGRIGGSPNGSKSAAE